MIFSCKELSDDEIRALGVDLSMVQVCRKIRRLARLDRIQLDTAVYSSELYVHLIAYSEYCGMDKHTFIKDFLTCLQPFMIYRKSAQDDCFICVIDDIYRISVRITADASGNKVLAASFGEDNKSDEAEPMIPVAKPVKTEYVAVLEKTCRSVVKDSGVACVEVLMQRGLKVLPLSLAGRKYGAVFIVRRNDIERALADYCSEYLIDLYTSDLPLDYSRITPFTSLQQIPFTPYGRDVFETFSLLIDALCIQQDAVSKAAADFAIVEYAGTLSLTAENRDELLDTLEERYKASGVKAMPEIIFRIKTALE